ncbi:dioxygenase [Actinomadura mexicana]|uniref:Catechol 1,2-dioxygenase/hydroxyquinol 1,2-dioxygenase n=1 Tax=Actinomadura mexicana TaxID=134959 RepID=A0A238W1W1_9ACTN|nr:dioxygenase [Actinomadura mexicana]SNR40344.1 catechol 1,2-dioxygenase/hydroxyquinol 1,2-dioxygenase [Actinomadura mexicana]
MDFNEHTATRAVQESFRDTPDPRLRELLDALTRHLHAFVGEVRPSIGEWEQAIKFLTAVGQTCTDTRQEFVLLSDVMGVSMLVETLNEHEDGTEGTVLGPFHMVESPPRALGDSIDLIGEAQPCLVAGSVLSSDGNLLPDAEVDVWQCNEKGFYDVQQPGVQPSGNGRGLFHTDSAGRFRFRTVLPSHYPIPTDGPVGRLLTAAGRHPYRPAHIHFIVQAEGHTPLTTHVFVAGSPYLDSDAVFAVKQSLICDFTESNDAETAARNGVQAPFRHAEFDFILSRKLT